MTDSEYDKLVQFAGQYLVNMPFEQTFYNTLREIPRVNFVYCSNCLFHGDCAIEKSLPGDSDLKFCSYGKVNFTIIDKENSI